MTSPAPARYEPAPTVLLTDLSETEACLLDTRTLYYYALNETGRLIWNELAAQRTPQETARTLLAHYDVDEADALGHVQALLQTFVEDGLVVAREAA